ncbi:MAG TPA: nicotinate-nucleotide--dimethylbenzimidazole phosphoribosyltransferase [Hyphomicrobiales bacterium]|nr:nicotinate-nucleotide--dimethylbenzimidazole phosphoribosyltransferase [Hyphomicrobiales bacterium]
MIYTETLPPVSPLDRSLEPYLRRRIDGKAKPIGSLGHIEELAIHIGLVTETHRSRLGRAALAVFAGDHGIVAEGVTAYPSEVSALVAQMILDGRAGANIAARAAAAEVFLVDAGLDAGLPAAEALIEKKIRRGTRNFLHEPAMTEQEALSALEAGINISARLKKLGFGILALGEIGIGNSSAAAIVTHAVTGLPLDKLVGMGAGCPARGLDHKRQVLARAYARAPVRSGFDALREFGGFEMAMLIGAMFGAYQHRQILLIDGFIATACACIAVALEGKIRDYLLFAHRSPEAGHGALLEWLDARPLLDLGMRLGEGTGAALAIPLIRMAEGLLNEMADLPGEHPPP